MYSKGFYRNMILLKKEISQRRDKEGAEVWLHIKSVLEKGGFSSYKRAGELSSLILNGFKDSYIARNFGVEESTIRIHKRNLSKELYDLFGDDFFELFDNFKMNKDEINSRIYVAEHSGSVAFDLIIDEIQTLLNAKLEENRMVKDFKPEEETISFDSCNAEISFLVRHSKSKIKDELNALNMDKLAYLVGILNLKCGSSKERYELLSLLGGK